MIYVYSPDIANHCVLQEKNLPSHVVYMKSLFWQRCATAFFVSVQNVKFDLFWKDVIWASRDVAIHCVLLERLIEHVCFCIFVSGNVKGLSCDSLLRGSSEKIAKTWRFIEVHWIFPCCCYESNILAAPCDCVLSFCPKSYRRCSLRRCYLSRRSPPSLDRDAVWCVHIQGIHVNM